MVRYLADDKQLSLKILLRGTVGAAADKNLAVRRLAFKRGFPKAGIVSGNGPPAQNRLAFRNDDFLKRLFTRGPDGGVR